MGGTGVLVGGGSGVTVGSGRGVSVGWGGTVSVAVGGGAFVGVREGVRLGTTVGVALGRGVDEGSGVGAAEGCCATCRVLVGQVAVRDGRRVGVVEIVADGGRVNVRIRVAEGDRVAVRVGELVSVVNSVANASMVMARCVLRVGVTVLPPVFGIIKSGSGNECRLEPDSMNGRLKAIPHVARIRLKIRYSLVRTLLVSFRASP